MSRILSLLLLVLTIASLIAGISIFQSQPTTLWTVLVTLVPGWFLFWAKYLYDRWERLRIGAYHLVGMLTNRRTEWSLDVEYVIKNEKSAVEVLDRGKEAVLKALGAKAELWQNDAHQKIVNSDGSTLRLRILPYSEEPDLPVGQDEGYLLSCQLSKAKVPYNDSKKLLVNSVLPVFEAIEQRLNPVERKYVLEVGFNQDLNPYYGYFISQVPADNMRQFAIEFDVLVSGLKHTVSVEQSSLKVIATQLSALHRLASRYISFSTSTLPVD